ncbi:hypothetical protein ACFQX4_23500 [Roseomonas sp. GCM10028921]
MFSLTLRGVELILAERGITVSWPDPRRGAIKAALLGMEMSEADAERFARDCGRSLAALRRLLPAATGRTAPVWSQSPVARRLVPAALAGAWQENNAADRAALGRLAGADYATVVEALAPWVAGLESPLRRAGDAWKIASSRDAWFRLTPFVTAADLDTFAVRCAPWPKPLPTRSLLPWSTPCVSHAGRHGTI